MPDAIILGQHENIPIKTKAVRTFEDDEDALKSPGVNRVFSVVHHDASSPKTYYKLPGYRPPKIKVKLTSVPIERDGRNSFVVQWPRAGAEIHEFVTDKLIQFVQQHQEVYLKDAEGGGGRNIAHLAVKHGHLVLRTTNKELWAFLQKARPMLKTLTALGIHGPDQAQTRLGQGTDLIRQMAELVPRFQEAYKLAHGVDQAAMDDYTKSIHPSVRQNWDQLVRYWKKNEVESLWKGPERRMSLGPIDSIHPQTLHVLSKAIGLSMVPEKEMWVELLAEKATPHLQVKGRPVEFRFYLQRTGNGKYRVSAHFAKIGALSFASNVGQGGRTADTKKTLMNLLKSQFPTKTPKEHARMARVFLKQAIERAERFSNQTARHMASNRKDEVGGVKFDEKTALGFGRQDIADAKDKEFYLFFVPPVLTTMDALVMPTKSGIEPAFMEYHASGHYGIKDEFNSGVLPKRTWKLLMRRHTRNIRWLHRRMTSFADNYEAQVKEAGLQEE